MNKDISGIEARGFRWRQALFALAAMLVLFGAFYYEILSALVDWWWTTSKYAHSLIIFPAIVYLLYIDRSRFSRLWPVPSYLALLLVVPLGIAVPLFQFIDVQILAETALVLLLPAIIWTTLGSQIIRVMVIPLALIITVAPIWELFSPFLTQVTASVAHASLNLLGIPVFRDEMYLRIPEGVFEIAEGCGGFRYFISGLSLGLIFAQLNFRSLRNQVFIVVAAVLLSILTNWIRVMIVIWAGHVTDMQHPYVHEHVTLGWYVFAAAFFLYFFLCNRFIEVSSPEGHTRAASERDSNNSERNYLVQACPVILIVAACVILPPFLLGQQFNDREETELPIEFTEVSGWSGPYVHKNDWKPEFNGATQEQLVSYGNGKTVFDVYFASYSEQAQGKELINVNNSVTNKDAMAFQPKRRTLSFQGGELEVESIRVESLRGESFVWRWYIVAGVETTDRKLAKMLELKNLFTEKPVSMVVAVSAQGAEYKERDLIEKLEDLLGKLYIPVFGFVVDQ